MAFRSNPEIANIEPFAPLVPQRPDSPAYRRALEVAVEATRLARQILGPRIEVIWFGSWPRGRAHDRS
ncbi:MAG: hypothetical protein ACREQ9_17230, partial [Candidatus Binatia bacterium]